VMVPQNQLSSWDKSGKEYLHGKAKDFGREAVAEDPKRRP
jgi:hypothetical protein